MDYFVNISIEQYIEDLKMRWYNLHPNTEILLEPSIFIHGHIDISIKFYIKGKRAGYKCDAFYPSHPLLKTDYEQHIRMDILHLERPYNDAMWEMR